MTKVHIKDKHQAFISEAYIPIQGLLEDLFKKPVTLNAIAEPELLIADNWMLLPERRAKWNWRIAVKKERQRSKRIEVSFYSKDILCALMLARFSRSRVTICLRYLEANPLPHPLEGDVLTAATVFSEQLGYAIKAKQILISNPVESMVERYRSRGYQLTVRDQWRESRGFKPRCDLLVKELEHFFDDTEAVL